MEKVYQSFEDLVAQNKSVFRLMEKSGQRGLAKAIWESRQSEFNALKNEIESLQKEKRQLREELRAELRAQKNRDQDHFDQEAKELIVLKAKSEAQIQELQKKNSDTRRRKSKGLNLYSNLTRFC